MGLHYGLPPANLLHTTCGDSWIGSSHVHKAAISKTGLLICFHKTCQRRKTEREKNSHYWKSFMITSRHCAIRVHVDASRSLACSICSGSCSISPFGCTRDITTHHFWLCRNLDKLFTSMDSCASSTDASTPVNPVSYTHLTLPTNREV